MPDPFRPSPPRLTDWILPVVIVAALATGLWGWSQRTEVERLQRSLAEERSRTSVTRSLSAPRSEPRDVEPRTTASPSPARPQPPQPIAATPARVTIYLCRAYSGGSFWTSGTCSAQGGVIDRMTSVPGNLSFSEQVAIASREAADAAALYSPPNIAQTPSSFGNGGSSATEPIECPSLRQEIINLDAMARSPQPAQTQDWIKERRQGVRTQQFRLHCP